MNDETYKLLELEGSISLRKFWDAGEAAGAAGLEFLGDRGAGKTPDDYLRIYSLRGGRFHGDRIGITNGESVNDRDLEEAGS